MRIGTAVYNKIAFMCLLAIEISSGGISLIHAKFNLNWFIGLVLSNINMPTDRLFSVKPMFWI